MRAAFFSRNGAQRTRALRFLIERDQKDVIPAFIAVLRLLPDEDGRLLDALQRLARANIPRDWKAWTEWQEEHTEIRPYRGFVSFKADILAGIDPNFRDFLYRGVRHRIRIEEIVWGGVKKDGIPALVNAEQIPAAEAAYLTDRELVFGVSINGDSRAYPLRILDWHEMFNDVVGGVPVSLAYCTLCGSGNPVRHPGSRTPETLRVRLLGAALPVQQADVRHGDGVAVEPVHGGAGGRRTHRVRDRAEGPAGGDHELEGLAYAAHPDTTVLSLDTGFDRDYRPGRPYGQYFASPELMFPVVVRDRRLDPKDRIFVLRDGEAEMAWALSLFAGGAALHDRVGGRDVVAHRRRRVRNGACLRLRGPHVQRGGGRSGPRRERRSALEHQRGRSHRSGRRNPRRGYPGHMAYWFAYQSYHPGKPVRTE